MKYTKCRHKAGRPPRDVSAEVRAYVSTELGRGRTLAEIARQGLVVICDLGCGPNSIRRLKGKHLEAAYRLAEKLHMVPWLRPTVGYRHGVPMFMGRLLPIPIGAALPSVRKPGRPKKNARTHD